MVGYKSAGSILLPHPLTGYTVSSLGNTVYSAHTARCNRLDMLAPLDPTRDLRLSGQVIYTGRSSMEVAVKMETIGMGLPEQTVLLGAEFVFTTLPWFLICDFI